VTNVNLIVITCRTFLTKHHSQLAYLDFPMKIITTILLIFINLVQTSCQWQPTKNYTSFHVLQSVIGACWKQGTWEREATLPPYCYMTHPSHPIDLITLITFGVEYQQIMKSPTIEFPTVFRAFPQLSLNYLSQYPILEHPRSIFFLHFKVLYSRIVTKY
jgi:hypothetical protein